MKQCPRCKKEVDDHAKICPHCGYHLESNYQPIKKGKQGAGAYYAILVLIMIISPLVFSYFFTLPTSSSTNEPTEQVTLGPLGKVDINKEQTVYHFDNLDNFNKKISGVDTYVKNIKAFEKDIKDITSSYATSTIDTSYDIYVTNENNIYFSLSYDIVHGGTIQLSLDLEYDMSGTTKDANTTMHVDNFNDFESMKIRQDSYPVFQEITSLINGKDEQVEFMKAGEKFNALESTFNKKDGVLSHYGVGVSVDTCSIKAVPKKDKYYLRVKYNTKINTALFI